MHIYYFNPDKINLEDIHSPYKEVENSTSDSSTAGGIDASAGVMGFGKLRGKANRRLKKSNAISKVYKSGSRGEKARIIKRHILANKRFIRLEKGSQFKDIKAGQIVVFENSCKPDLKVRETLKAYAEYFGKDILDWESRFGKKLVVFSTSKKNIIGKSLTRRAFIEDLTFEVLGLCVNASEKRITISPIVISNDLEKKNG